MDRWLAARLGGQLDRGVEVQVGTAVSMGREGFVLLVSGFAALVATLSPAAGSSS